MSVTSVVTIDVNFSGDVVFGQDFEGPTPNTLSPGMIENKTLASGANTITVPSGAKGCTLVPPEDNTTAVTLKGVSGDTGIGLALTNPAHITLNSVSSFVLTAAAQITNFRLIWS